MARSVRSGARARTAALAVSALCFQNAAFGVAPGSLNARLNHYRGSRTRLTRPDEPHAPELRVPALAHHRLVFETAPLPGQRESHYKVYEVVPGARVHGRAPPGSRVRARLPLRTSAGNTFRYATETTAGPGGRYELVLPYPTDAAGGDVEAGSPWELDVRGRRALLPVSEEAVRTGRPIAGPSWGRRPSLATIP